MNAKPIKTEAEYMLRNVYFMLTVSLTVELKS